MTSLQRKIYIAASATALLLLIFDAKTALSGASEGLSLCLTTIIPSLFPFFVITILLTGALSDCRLPGLAPLGKLLHLPKNGEMLLIIGLLGGYPIGAQCVRQAYCDGQLSRKNAERMLAFCSNAGPAFIFGIGATILPEIWMCWLVWLIQILSAFLVGYLTPQHDAQNNTAPHKSTVFISEAIRRSICVMATVCGWIVLFRIVQAFLNKWLLWMLPADVSILISGFLELANGCAGLSVVESIPKRFYMFSLMLSGGGLCVAMQTQGVLMGSGLSLRPYLIGKIVQCAACSMLAILFMPMVLQIQLTLPVIFVLFLSASVCILYGIYSRKAKKGLAFFRRVVYNSGKAPGGNTYEVIS